MACLPLTNFPFFPPAIGGGALVRPLSIYPLFILIPLVVLPRLLRARLPRSLIALGIFVLMVVISGLFSMMREVTPVMDVSGGQRVLRVLITLGLGCAFYLTVALAPRNYDELKAGLRAMYAGFSLALFWACFQVVYILNFQRFYFKIINRLQGYITTRRLFENRVSGMTYEPSWFAEQITILLLPWLLASVITGRSVFKLRWRWLTVELFLLVWSIVILVFTFSRAGILDLAVLALLSLALFYFHKRSLRKNPSIEGLHPRKPTSQSRTHPTCSPGQPTIEDHLENRPRGPGGDPGVHDPHLGNLPGRTKIRFLHALVGLLGNATSNLHGIPAIFRL